MGPAKKFEAVQRAVRWRDGACLLRPFLPPRFLQASTSGADLSPAHHPAARAARPAFNTPQFCATGGEPARIVFKGSGRPQDALELTFGLRCRFGMNSFISISFCGIERLFSFSLKVGSIRRVRWTTRGLLFVFTILKNTGSNLPVNTDGGPLSNAWKGWNLFRAEGKVGGRDYGRRSSEKHLPA